MIWLIYGILVVGLVVRHKLWIPLRNWTEKWEVVENRVERGNARTLVLRPVGHNGFSFEPGQFSWLKLGRTPFGLGQHPISMSCAGDVEPGGNVSFTIKALGDWSGKQVPALQAGDTIWLDGPHGVFTIDREQAMGYVLVGGGVGITPLHSMCQTMANRKDPRPVLLFYGANNEEDLSLIEGLEDLKRRMNLTLVPVLSKPSPDWKGETGYINVDIMRRYVPEQVKWFKFLICGPAPLMDAPTIAWLALEGVLFGSHLASHRAADGLSTRELADELTRSRAILRQWLDGSADSFAAPFGVTDERLRLLAAECGFRTGFNTEPGVAHLTNDPFNLPRIEVRGDLTLEDFITQMQACR